MTLNNDWIENAKKNAAQVVITHVTDRSVIGLGSGSTVAYAIIELGKKVKREKLKILGIPSSYQAFLLATKYGIKITTLEEHPIIDLTIDGADQIDPKLNLIKGMGAALTREKIIALASKTNIIIADERKKVAHLGIDDHPVPVEVLPFALTHVTKQIKKIGGKSILREGTGKVGPVMTDNGNVILDTFFGLIKDPTHLNNLLKMITGVVETGLFIGQADLVYLGKPNQIEKIERK